MKIDDLQTLAAQVASLPTLKRRRINPNEAIYKAWLADKSVGPFATLEFDVDEGGRAVICLTGKILWWKGSGDEVTVI